MGIGHESYWRLRPNAPESGRILCGAGELGDDEARGFDFGRGRSRFSMFIVRSDEGIRGYLNLCPHFSLPLNHTPNAFLADGHIQCFQHFARFRITDGVCISGACEGEALHPVPVRLNTCNQFEIG